MGWPFMKQRAKPGFPGMTLLLLPKGTQEPSVSFCCHKVGQVQSTGIGERKQKLEHHLPTSMYAQLELSSTLNCIYQGKDKAQ